MSIKILFNKEIHLYRGIQNVFSINDYISKAFKQPIPQNYKLRYLNHKQDLVTINGDEDVKNLLSANQVLNAATIPIIFIRPPLNQKSAQWPVVLTNKAWKKEQMQCSYSLYQENTLSFEEEEEMQELQLSRKQNGQGGFMCNINPNVHKNIQCNTCGVNPICGVRYTCTICNDFDMCENCEKNSTHDGSHVFYKIKNPNQNLDFLKDNLKNEDKKE